MKKVFIKLIEKYQKTISPDHSEWGKLRFPHGYCQFYPSCSEYARQSIEERGSLKGIALGVWRVLRCNPFSHGGVDEVKHNTNKRMRTNETNIRRIGTRLAD